MKDNQSKDLETRVIALVNGEGALLSRYLTLAILKTFPELFSTLPEELVNKLRDFLKLV